MISWLLFYFLFPNARGKRGNVRRAHLVLAPRIGHIAVQTVLHTFQCAHARGRDAHALSPRNGNGLVRVPIPLRRRPLPLHGNVFVYVSAAAAFFPLASSASQRCSTAALFISMRVRSRGPTSSNVLSESGSRTAVTLVSS